MGCDSIAEYAVRNACTYQTIRSNPDYFHFGSPGFLQGFKPTAAGGEGHTFARSTAASRALVRLSMVRLVRPSSLSGLNEARQFFNRNRIVSKRIRLLGRTSI